MTLFPTKQQLLRNFLSCINWEEKYMYIIDLGNLLLKFPENLRTTTNLITGCQSHTWIALINTSDYNTGNNTINFHGDSDAVIVKGIIVIIFDIYQNLDIKSIISLDSISFLNKLQLNHHLTVSRSQGVYSILNAIRKQACNLNLKQDN